jgi:hypothetical protein
MSINRHNYEEFFILYMDNELSSDQRREVELFVQANADLKEEFDMLQQSKLVMDEAIVFDNKELLLRPAGHIDITNYEEWLLLYIDNELDSEQKIIVEKFAASHPAVREELNILQKSRLQPETIIFPDKESLYRKEQPARRVVMVRWTRVAVAAALLFAVSTAGFFVFRNNDTPGTSPKSGIAEGKEIKNPSNSAGQVTNKDNKQTTGIETTSTKEEQDAIKEEIQPRQSGVNGFAVKTTDRSRINPVEEPIVPDQHPTEISSSQPRNIQGPIKQNGFIDPKPSYASLTDLQQNIPDIAVTTREPGTLNSQTQSEDEIAYANTSERKNSRLRGFFRKVTRTIEKTTNIKTTDDDDRLLVAGLAIRL